MERVFLQAAVMGTFLILGVIYPRRAQKLLSTDLWINVLTGGAIFLLVAPLVGWIKTLSLSTQFSLLSFPQASSWVHFLLMFLLLDFSRYWLHYAHHRVPFLWSFHRVHHSSESLDATSGLRMHVVDFIQLGCLPIFLFVFLFDTHQVEDWVLPYAMTVGVFFDAFQHSNIKMDMTKPWNKLWHLLLNNPHFHVWHHTREGHRYDGNYGNTLVVWDRLFGTDVTQSHIPEQLGISSEQALVNSPLSLQLLRSRASQKSKDTA
ncbi:MAG: hypothetical protein CMK59_02010 [Proteobacteria bacterium]|nr:hypothetical protein [Pseudomonadota bacterium]